MPKQYRNQRDAFVAEMLADPMRNATRAAIRAGYAENSAREQAYQLMQREDVRAAIAEAETERDQRLAINADDVVREMVRMAMVDVSKFKDVKTLEDLAKMPEDDRRAVVGYAIDKHGNLKLEFIKGEAVNMLARRYSLYNDKIEVKMIVGLAERMRQRDEKLLEQGETR